MGDKLVIIDGMIDPKHPETIAKIMEEYPNYIPLMVLPGEIHAIKQKNKPNSDSTL